MGRAFVLAVAAASALLVLGVLDRALYEPEEVRGDAMERPLREAIDDFRPGELVPVLPRDGIAAVFEPESVPAAEAGLTDADRVLGVEVGGEGRAYAISVLSAHEVVNDQAAGIPFAVTWCPLCSTAVVYGRRVGGRTLSFGVSGMLYRNSLVLYDRETGSLWSHLLGVALQGPLAGTELESIPSVVTTWGAWRQAHPGTLAFSAGRAPYDAYEGYYRSSQTGVLRVRRRDSRLGQKELVLAVLSPSAKAYAFRDLEQRGTIADVLAGRNVEVVFDPEAGSAAAFEVESDGRKPLPSTPIFWFAWVDIFPGAPLWEQPVEAPRGGPGERASPDNLALSGAPLPRG
jgi:hypothetical protein